MNNQNSNFSENSKNYLAKLSFAFTDPIISKIEKLANHLYKTWEAERNLFICGNGGNAANAIRMANDFH